MFFKVLRLQVKKEIEELKSLHRIELAEKESQLTIKLKEQEASNELKVKEVISLLKLEADQRMKQAEMKHQEQVEQIRRQAANELLSAKEEVLRQGYEKLSTAMGKLHEEGNLTTKFTQQLALSMMKSNPGTKSQVKVVTSGKK